MERVCERLRAALNAWLPDKTEHNKITFRYVYPHKAPVRSGTACTFFIFFTVPMDG